MTSAGTTLHRCLGCSLETNSSLRCPTCLKSGKDDQWFCSQDCFKANWPKHKAEAHNADGGGGGQKQTATTDPWPGFKYTGTLRPHYPLSPYRPVPERILRPDYAIHPQGVSLLEQNAKRERQVKVLDDDEIAGLRVACKLGRECLDEAARVCDIGVTTDEIDRAVHEAAVERECYPSPLGYYKFPKSCCTSVNEVICHGIPDGRKLVNGDLCNVDVTVYHRGFHGDLNETFLVGDAVDETARKLVQATHDSLAEAIALVRPGVKFREIGNTIERVAKSRGFSVVRSFCGHGIHRLFHTAPNIPHYAKNSALGVIHAGNAFTIEPMINEGVWQDERWPDDWTAVTRDGKRSAQFEQTLLVTDNGCEILTARQSGRPHFLDQIEKTYAGR